MLVATDVIFPKSWWQSQSQPQACFESTPSANRMSCPLWESCPFYSQITKKQILRVFLSLPAWWIIHLSGCPGMSPSLGSPPLGDPSVRAVHSSPPRKGVYILPSLLLLSEFLKGGDQPVHICIPSPYNSASCIMGTSSFQRCILISTYLAQSLRDIHAH